MKDNKKTVKKKVINPNSPWRRQSALFYGRQKKIELGHPVVDFVIPTVPKSSR